MTTTEIKKELYKQNPTAYLEYIRKGKVYYLTFIEMELSGNSLPIKFEIPVNDMGDADFTPKMEAKLLNRWIINE